MITFVRSSKEASRLRFVSLQTLQKINDISATHIVNCYRFPTERVEPNMIK